MSIPLAITGCGMVTGVGLTAPASCAAIRCAIDNFQETRFMDNGGEWIMASEVELEKPWRGEVKLIKMAAKAIQECLENNKAINPEATPLLLCLSEPERVGRVIRDNEQFFYALQRELKLKFHPKSRIISMGHVAIGTALQRARELIQEDHCSHVLIAATDSYLVASTLMDYQEKERLLTRDNSNGFIPGEAAAAIVVEPVNNKSGLIIKGIGYGYEEAHIDSEKPLQGIGLSNAIKEALKEVGCKIEDLDFRITDISGEQYHFKESTLALGRLVRIRRKNYDIWHPADCIGETGVVIGLVILQVIKAAAEKGYLEGNEILAHCANDDEKRIALVLSNRGAI